jgi:hypothetical protein
MPMVVRLGTNRGSRVTTAFIRPSTTLGTPSASVISPNDDRHRSPALDREPLPC